MVVNALNPSTLEAEVDRYLLVQGQLTHFQTYGIGLDLPVVVANWIREQRFVHTFSPRLHHKVGLFFDLHF